LEVWLKSGEKTTTLDPPWRASTRKWASGVRVIDISSLQADSLAHSRFVDLIALYPQLQPHYADDFTQPLQLLARSLHFDDPLSGLPRHFLSQRQLLPL